MRNSKSIDSLVTSSVIGTQAVFTTLCVQLSTNMLISGSLQFLLGAIDQIQLIIHLPILDVKFPANTMLFYNYIVPIVNFDVLSEVD